MKKDAPEYQTAENAIIPHAPDHKKRTRITCILAVGVDLLTVGCSLET